MRSGALATCARTSPSSLSLAVAADGHTLKNAATGAFAQTRGDAAWSAIAELSHSDCDQYLTDRAGRYFNATLIESIESGTYGGRTNFAGQDPFGGSDFTTFTQGYWQLHDYYIRQSALKGMWVYVCPAYWGRPESEGWAVQMRAAGTGGMTTYGNFLRDRYANDNNIIWVMGGDERLTGDSGVQIGLYNALAAGIAGNGKLITTHWARPSTGTDGSPSWLTLNCSYTNDTNVSSRVLADYQATALPTVHIEAVYEGSFQGGANVGASVIRQQAWQAYLSGACGHISGNHTVWNFLSGWQSALNSAGSQHMAVLNRFLAKNRWQPMIPDASSALITAGRGTNGTAAYVSAVLGSDGALAAAYVQAGTTITADLSQMFGTANVPCWWLDPTNGQMYQATGSPLAQSSQVFVASTQRGNNAAGDPDWVWLAGEVAA